MSGRLIITIVSTITEEAAILILGILLLPKADINIPLPLLLVIMLIWLGWSVFTYQKGTRALGSKPVNGLVSMTGMKGTVIKPLQPEGLVRINGELWQSHSVSGRIEAGMKVTVEGQEGLKLLVRLDSYNPTVPASINNGNNDQDNAAHR